jgi:hypothetical protein
MAARESHILLGISLKSLLNVLRLIPIATIIRRKVISKNNGDMICNCSFNFHELEELIHQDKITAPIKKITPLVIKRTP